MKRLYDLVRLNFAIYPGIVDFRSAAFLAPYYARMQRGQGALRIAFNALFYAAFRLFIVLRARQVAHAEEDEPRLARGEGEEGQSQ